MFHRKVAEEIIPVETKIWCCMTDTCNTWVRDNFKNGDNPTCPICNGEMTEGTKLLPPIENPLQAEID